MFVTIVNYRLKALKNKTRAVCFKGSTSGQTPSTREEASLFLKKRCRVYSGLKDLNKRSSVALKAAHIKTRCDEQFLQEVSSKIKMKVFQIQGRMDWEGSLRESHMALTKMS